MKNNTDVLYNKTISFVIESLDNLEKYPNFFTNLFLKHMIVSSVIIIHHFIKLQTRIKNCVMVNVATLLEVIQN